MFVLTVRQPWAWAIIYAGKDIENRTWKPRRQCRVLIHAGKTLDADGLVTVRLLRKRRMIEVPVPRVFPAGQIIGAVDVVGWDHQVSNNEWAVPSRWHWHLENPVPADPPIEMTGQPSFFRPPLLWQRSFPGLEDQ